MTLLEQRKQKALVDEIMSIEDTSTEAMPGHYVTNIFLQIVGVKDNLSSGYTYGKVHVRVTL